MFVTSGMAAVALGLLLGVGSADDSALYAPAPPPGSAFVRVLQAGPKAADGAVGKASVGTVAVGMASEYIVVPQGAVSVKSGTAAHPVTVEASKYYSVAVHSGAPVVFTDTAPSSANKAVVVVYNLSTATSVSLTTADGSVAIVSDIAPGKSGHRELNPLAVPLVVSGPAGTVKELGERVLERGSAYSVVVTGQGDALTASWSAARTRPLR